MVALLDRPKDVSKLSEAPEKALRFEFSELKFVGDAADVTTKGKNTKSREIEILARTPDALNHWYWGAIVHDFAGMSAKQKIVLDYCHDDYEIVGYADEFIVDERGLVLRGRIESVADNDTEASRQRYSVRGLDLFSATVAGVCSRRVHGQSEWPRFGW
jgi:hypothetical protein